MKVGIQKLHENEWQVNMGCASVKMDRFSVALLHITLEHLLALEHGQSHSTLKSYVKLGLKLDDLDDLGLQKVLSEVDSKAVLDLVMLAEQPEFTDRVLKNLGGILAKQLKADLDSNNMPEEQQAKESIQHIIEKMFDLEASGKIEFIKEDTQYI
ncbi:FliG C-terminal domain-containing protein [Thiomicrorhabdus sp. ZW0627]|uniref:FliG C-terminal domain-containing protein n=1 Tax=Thiomicrorhabdus sp. ZW0627 TaxID=3039774 RepID=UPI0024367D61|nr:FliG C-terminal domain-containing protein [Thiomicrorhabdus sp. ZW0627]MDG6773758.1 FliG C-terminal domain-containing protein [Thiomicrorhabdus sp. ZW0627]